MGIGNSFPGVVLPKLFMHLQLNPIMCPPLAGRVDGGHVQYWDIDASCHLFILICLVCLTKEVTWLKVYGLSRSAGLLCSAPNGGCSMLFCRLQDETLFVCGRESLVSEP